MSVHRAGSYYGVPHSTLEYKVKERNKLRPKIRRPTSVTSSIANLPTLVTATNVKFENVELSGCDINLDKESSPLSLKTNFLDVMKKEIKNLPKDYSQNEINNLIENKNNLQDNIKIDQKSLDDKQYVEKSKRIIKNLLETDNNLSNTSQEDFKLSRCENETSTSAAASSLVALSTTA